MTLTFGGTLATAFVRALIAGVILGSGVAVSVWATTDATKPVAVAFFTTLLGTAGLRGFAEGLIDSERQKSGDVQAADVQPAGSGKA